MMAGSDEIDMIEPELLKRQHCIALASLALLPGTLAAQPDQPAAAAKGQRQPAQILVLGDSISAEYGLPRGSGWVALLERKLAQTGLPASVFNASVSGETTSGGRSRLAGLLRQQPPSVLLIELGANDALRGLPLQMTHDNLAQMAQMGRAAGARVLLLGMQVPPNYGSDYARRFAELFAKVAQQQQAALVPFLLKGVADAPDPTALFQADRIHPNVQAQPIMLANVWPLLNKLLA